MKPIKFNNNNHLPKEALILYKPKQKNNDMKSWDKYIDEFERGLPLLPPQRAFVKEAIEFCAAEVRTETIAETRSEMMDFAEWIKEDVDSDFYMGILQWKVYLSATRHLWFQTTNELLSYWLTNIKGK